jgi:site-specific DNA-methyltransferase (adenine-specific)
MSPHLRTRRVTLHHGDCREVLATLPDASVDSVVTDPPYELGFMGKAWDASGVAYDCALWREVLRVLKPGGHLLAFGGTRTYHRLACAVEDAGFEIRDSIHWFYGSGFPKSLDVSKAINKAAGAEREVVGPTRPGAQQSAGNAFGAWGDGITSTAPATPEAASWEGWGTALKPAHEPVVVARKPLVGTVAANVLAHGTGALNVDGCRVKGADAPLKWSEPRGGIWQTDPTATATATTDGRGRWPANVVLDPEAAEVLDRQSGETRSASGGVTTNALGAMNDDAWQAQRLPRTGHDDSGGASRFFTVAGFTDDDLTSFRYVAKPDRAERNAGLFNLAEHAVHRFGAGIGEGNDLLAPAIERNFHPTVKPLDLMRWLVRLVTPPGGTVLDPFAGSGTTLAAAVLEDRQAIGIELTADYLPLIAGRVAWAEREARFGAVQGPTQVRKDAGAASLFDEDGAA